MCQATNASDEQHLLALVQLGCKCMSSERGAAHRVEGHELHSLHGIIVETVQKRMHSPRSSPYENRISMRSTDESHGGHTVYLQLLQLALAEGAAA